MDVIMPQLGETVAEGKIANWFKAVGDTVAAGENLFEIETDKVTMEVPVTTGGILSEIRAQVGETVRVGAVVAVLGKPGDSAAPRKEEKTTPPPRQAEKAPAAPRKTETKPAVQPATPTRAMTPFDEVHTPDAIALPGGVPLGLKITPLARRLIDQGGLDIAAIARGVKARGGWRIAAADVGTGAADAAPRPAIEAGAGDTVEPLNRIRAQTASRLAEAWRTAPHVYQAVEADVSGIDRARRAAKAGFAERHGVALTYLPFIARALCLALAEFPRINASFDRDRLILHRDINLGIAVDLDHAGLVVPVVPHADEMTVGGLAKAIARQVDKARTGKLTPADLAGGTYTLTNNGSFGTLLTTPILNLPQVAILSLDGVQKRAVAVETPAGDAVAVRPMVMLGQSFDHRAMDGAYGAAFLKRLKAIVETRDWAGDLN